MGATVRWTIATETSAPDQPPDTEAPNASFGASVSSSLGDRLLPHKHTRIRVGEVYAARLEFQQNSRDLLP